MVFFQHNEINESTVKFKALEDDVVLGECTLILSDIAEVTDVTFDNNSIYVVEGLLKAAFYFAGLRGIFWGVCKDESIGFALRKLNFVKSEKGYENDIPTILQGSCGNCSNNS